MASDVNRGSLASGAQGDFSYQIDENNILRTGFAVSSEKVSNKNSDALFEADDEGNQLSSRAFTISNQSTKNSQNYGIYL